MNRPITADSNPTNMKVVHDLYRRFATNKPRREQVDITDAVLLLVKAKR